jgi:hypothetical protein
MTKYQIKSIETGEIISPERFTFETMTGAEVGIVHIEDICDLLDKPCPRLEVVPVDSSPADLAGRRKEQAREILTEKLRRKGFLED